MLAGHYACFLIPHEGYLYDYIFDTSSQQLSTNDRVNAYNGLYTPMAAHGNRFISYLDSYDIYKELVEYGFEHNDAVAQHLAQENSVLMIYSMK